MGVLSPPLMVYSLPFNQTLGQSEADGDGDNNATTHTGVSIRFVDGGGDSLTREGNTRKERRIKGQLPGEQ